MALGVAQKRSGTLGGAKRRVKAVGALRGTQRGLETLGGAEVRGSSVTPTAAALMFCRSVQGAFGKHGSGTKRNRKGIK